MNGSMILLALLPTINSTYRDQLLSAMTKVSENAFAHEPAVRQFALLAPRDSASDTTSLYSFERYTDSAAFQSHMNTTVVRDMFAWINATNIYQTQPTVHQLKPLDTPNLTPPTAVPSTSPLEFVRPELATAPDPFVVVRQIDYSGGAAAANASLPFWQTAVATARGSSNSSSSTTGTLAYSVFSSASQAGSIFTLSAYTNEAVYRKAAAAESSQDGTKESQPLFLKLGGGFLYKVPT